MVLDAVSNFVRGNTDAEVGTSDTTVSVADASIFPDPETDGEFNVVIWDAENFPRPDQDVDVEILRVTARNTTTDELTVTRGQEMTSAAAHPEGSAIHLSPTAKMFSDIEDTFTTEAEAADAAPVQSVFGRVGDVVAETGDYAATQISNFSSEVLTSISGSTIAPSDITNLWDGTVVTSDVNNTNTTTEALEAESVSIGNATATLTSGVDQTIPTDTATQVDFGGVESDDDGFDADTTDDSITVESSGVYLIKHTVRWSSDAVWENGARKRVIIRTGQSDIRTKDSQVFPVIDATSDETSIITKLDAGDVVSGRVLQETGEDVQINAFTSSFLGRLSVVRLG